MQQRSSKKTAGRRPARSGWSLRAAGAVAAAVAGGAEPYDRRRHLPHLLPVTPADLADDGIAGSRQIVTRLARALRAERNRGRAGHWTYDLNRHIGLAQAYAAESSALQAALRKRRPFAGRNVGRR
jgi:hypothetical protein